VAPYPLDVLDAETEGMVGYLLEQELGHHLDRERLATLLTQIVVDPDDPAFTHPTKFVGPTYDVDEACRLTDTRGWAMARDGDAHRRVVASPEPRQIVELTTIRLLVAWGVTVICSGGGGIPVIADGRGGLQGVEAVIDKDLAAELLARGVDADALVLLTDVDGVYEGYGTDHPRRVDRATVRQLRALDLPAGSMRPKVDAVCRFVERTGGFAAIGALDDADAILRGEAGTIVVP
jgi:carbamate kinase